ncbi:MYG1 family protein [Aporhodopirellula aestuarii]|uniref:MYG1 family protein n=1 Tax=Aporhodopirellula aestuarii TaxID=2950107 RepID=A0ABT0TWL1_9BACT|nr:MYG1 family protein [Aporhodopirellula aestuarii]MCM2369015.1 MYG1 family protein [Aporhodopirellula aestuarii]
MNMQLIVTHPGSAHKDDFLACSLLAFLHQVPIQRREPTDEDLADPSICVVDVGGVHDPKLGNFDHHQFPRDAPPLCALSLVLQSMGIYEDALRFYAWLRPAEWLDTMGPNKTAELMEIPRSALGALHSPLDTTLLNRFAKQTELKPENPIYQVMCMVGEDIVSYLRSLRQRLDYLKTHARYWSIETESEPIQVLFLEKSDTLLEDPSFGVYAFIESEGKQNELHAIVCPDRRGDGYGLSRYNDHPRMDFSKIESCDDVRFAHKNGFVAKVTATEPSRLKELLKNAVVKNDR